jgi:hypothetical protein
MKLRRGSEEDKKKPEDYFRGTWSKKRAQAGAGFYHILARPWATYTQT